MLDYDDLTEAARTLLTRSSGAAWVQYKLDQGIEHVLVDEAQDTSPRQWDIVNALTGISLPRNSGGQTADAVCRRR